MLLAANTAAAVSISILSVTTDASGPSFEIGDSITLEIGLSHSGGPVYAVGVSVYGYDRDVVEAVSIETPDRFMNDTVLSDGSAAGGFANFPNPDTGISLPKEIQEIIRESTPPRVGLFQGVSLIPIAGDGSLDPGVGGGAPGSGTVHARVTFRLIGEGLTSLLIGSDPSNDTVIRENGELVRVPTHVYSIGTGVVHANVVSAVRAVPEPSVALLLGLGLAALAKRGRRPA